MNRQRIPVLGLLLVLAAGAGQAVAQKKEDIYDPNANAKAVVASAVEKAKKDHKRVLLMWGGNWCGWCFKLHDVLKTDRASAKLLGDEYELIMVDSRSNAALAKELDATIKSVPFLTVLDGDGKVVTHSPTEPLEDGDHHDPAKVREFLGAWKAAPRDAEKVLSEALASAKKGDRRVLVHLGAPW
jgi:thiol-disulfide isomerase/thioredoxin